MLYSSSMYILLEREPGQESKSAASGVNVLPNQLTVSIHSNTIYNNKPHTHVLQSSTPQAFFDTVHRIVQILNTHH
jgi:hypothetical protein